MLHELLYVAIPHQVLPYIYHPLLATATEYKSVLYNRNLLLVLARRYSILSICYFITLRI